MSQADSACTHCLAATDLKDLYSGKKENPLLLSDSDGVSDSDLSEPEDELLIMSPEKLLASSSHPQAGPSSSKPPTATKPRKKAATVSPGPLAMHRDRSGCS